MDNLLTKNLKIKENPDPKAVEIMREWIKLLRSGEFSQTEGHLTLNNDMLPESYNNEEGFRCSFESIKNSDPNTHSYCCLGILCKIPGIDQYIDTEDLEYTQWCDFGFFFNEILDQDQSGSIFSYANDFERMNFQEIADSIEFILNRDLDEQKTTDETD